MAKDMLVQNDWVIANPKEQLQRCFKTMQAVETCWFPEWELILQHCCACCTIGSTNLCNSVDSQS